MKFHKEKAVSVVVLSLLLSATNCGEDERLPEFVDMVFIIPLSITPVQENFRIKDTLLLVANFPDTLKEYNSKKYYRLPNFNFGVMVNTLQLVSNGKYLSQQPGNSHQYDIFSETGQLQIAGLRGGFIHFSYQDKHYQLRVKLVPKAESISCILFTTSFGINNVSLADVVDVGVTADGRRKIPILHGIYFVLNEGDNNFHLLKENSRLAVTNFPVPNNIYGERYGTFTFSVGK